MSVTPVYTLWDLDTDAAAHDPQGCYGDGLCPLAVYASPEMARHALERATAQRKRVELRTMILSDPPARAELPTIDLDELEPAGGHSLRRESSPFASAEVLAMYPPVETRIHQLQARSEREADG